MERVNKEDLYGKSIIGEAFKKIDARERKMKRIKKVIGVSIGAIAIYFTCELYDWKLAIIIIAFIWGNNIENNSK